ncbi:porin family protein [Rubrivirga sp.]|uniref:porin family protein n=1 Tax=Rubrivirga sp. TaxID=1885344 RepID=UPI003C71C899
MRTLLLAAVLSLAAAPASAQPQFVVKGGLATATFSGDDVDFLFEDELVDQPRLGFTAGAGVLVPLSPSLGVQVEALYTQKGAVFEDEFGLPYQETTRLDYLEVPATLRLALPVGPLLDVGVSAGGYVGVPLSSEVAVEDGGDSFVNELDTNTDYGALVGLDIGSGATFVEARYAFGLTDAVDFDPALDVAPDYRNQSLTLTFGLRFGGDRYRGRY